MNLRQCVMARFKIVTYIELYKGKEFMVKCNEFGTTAMCLCLDDSLSSFGHIAVTDLWFGTVKSAVELMYHNGLYSTMLEKTAHKLYPRHLLNVQLQAVKFLDLQKKLFIATSSTDIPGPPCQIKHYGKISRLMIAYQYLESAAGIDIYNHVQTGSLGSADVWQTRNLIHSQFTGILGFMFTNSYLLIDYFKKLPPKHVDFKKNLANHWLLMILMHRLDVIKIQIKWPVLTLCKRLQQKLNGSKNLDFLLA